jgi:hypothetical protein
MPVTIKVEGLEELSPRFTAFPKNYIAGVKKTMELVLLFIWSKVPGYPPIEPNSYERTETLGRTLGVSPSGSKAGQPSIYKTESGGGWQSASFGMNLDYAKYVIGDSDTEQAYMHKPGYKGRQGWWTIPQTVLEASLDGIQELFDKLVDELAAFLDRKGV